MVKERRRGRPLLDFFRRHILGVLIAGFGDSIFYGRITTYCTGRHGIQTLLPVECLYFSN
jgi:hypothetical protein